MKCPKCHFENPPNTRFCHKCGTQLSIAKPPLPEQGLDESQALSTETLDKPALEQITGSTFADRYQIIEELGRGGMGIVYKVLDKEIDKRVALKLLSSEVSADKNIIERFRNELKIARDISHKYVCRMYDLNKHKGNYYITMEYVPGENLRSMIRMTKGLSVETAINISKQVCEGLAEAHRLGFVHRDLKPGNIMIDKEGNAKILDFGIARSMKAEGKTVTGVMIGTPEYMSPEQVEGGKADQLSDIYSLGVILFEMLTGRLPFQGDTPLSIAIKHKTETPPDPREINAQIPESLSHSILKCLDKDKERRYQRVEELLSELSRIEKDIPITEKDEIKKKIEAEKRRQVNRKKIFLCGGVAIILILLIVSWNYFIRGRGEAFDSIAVLPFETLGSVDEKSDLEYLSDGITENIINKLTQLPSLRKVIARNSVFHYKGKQILPQVVGRELGVDTVFFGRMSKRGDEVSVSVELVNAANNTQLWGERYVKKISEIFDVQEQISNSIIENLRLKLTGAELQRLAKRYTENEKAFEAYSRGRYFWNKRTGDNLNRAIEYFNQAIEMDPKYALAYAALANSYILLPEYSGIPPKDAYPKAEEAALKAIEIDDTLAESHVALAQIKRRFYYDWDGSQVEYRRAIELNPGFATTHHWFAYDLMCQTNFTEAIKEMERAYELDPLSLVINRNLGQVYYRAGMYDQAISILKKTLEMEPDFTFAHFHLGSIYLQLSMFEKALEEYRVERRVEQEREESMALYIDAWIGITYVKVGQQEKAVEILNEMIERSKHIYVSPTVIAMLHFELGKNDQGFQWLDKAYEGYDVRLNWLKLEPTFDLVRSDPRFDAMLRKVGF